MIRPAEVAVVGTVRVDLVVSVPRLPGPKETVHGDGLEVRAGGRGLSQAAAVAALGGRAALVARVGDDPWGRLLLDAIAEAGVDAEGVQVVAAPTGAAVVQVTPDGAATTLRTRSLGTSHDPGDIAGASRVLRSAPVTLVQLDLSAGTVAAALALVAGAGRRATGTLVPNHPLAGHVLELLHPVVVTTAEAAALLGVTADEVERDGVAASEALLGYGPRSVVTTLDVGGAAWAERAGAGMEAGPPVPAAESAAGAGHAFLGGLTLALARGGSLPASCAAGIQAGATAPGRWDRPAGLRAVS